MADANNSLDLAPIIQPVLEVVGLCIAGFIASYLPPLINLMAKKLHLQVSQAQNAKFTQEIQTAAGIIETKLDQGVLSVAHVQVDNPAMRAEASEVIKKMPDVVDSLGLNAKEVAAAIVGAVDTGSRSQPPILPVAVPLAAAAPSNTTITVSPGQSVTVSQDQAASTAG